MKKIIIVLASLAALVSCDKWLDGTTDSSNLSESAIWETEESANYYLDGFYTYIQKYGQFGEAQFGGSMTESLTDELKYGSEALGDKAGHPNNYVTNADAVTPDGCIWGIWGSAYNQVRRVNGFLNSREKFSHFDAQTDSLFVAQAKFFRAFLHFQLAKRHPKGIIYYKELPKSNDAALSSPEEFWQDIYDDLRYATKYLPEEWPSAQRGRITKGAAWAMLSRTMLYAERWQDAYDAADSVIQLNRYGLMDDYRQSWKGNNKESIIEFAFNKNGVTHNFDQDYVPFCFGYDYGALGTPTQEMVESYEKADGSQYDWSGYHDGSVKTRPDYESLEPRFQATVYYNGSVWGKDAEGNNKLMDCSVGGANGEYMDYGSAPYSYGKTTTGYFLRKLIDENHTDLKGIKSTQTWVEMRYAEVLLNKAEAAYRLGKNDYQSTMNEVRARVGLPEKNSTGEQWFKDYRHERKVELAFEGHQFWDLRRWKLADKDYPDGLNNYRCHALKITGSSFDYVPCDLKDRVFPAKLYNLGIPTTELRENNLIKEQFEEWR